jgi:hypothetical protein
MISTRAILGATLAATVSFGVATMAAAPSFAKGELSKAVEQLGEIETRCETRCEFSCAVHTRMDETPMFSVVRACCSAASF